MLSPHLLTDPRRSAADSLAALRPDSDGATISSASLHEFFETESQSIQAAHLAGGNGIEIAARRGALVDAILGELSLHPPANSDPPSFPTNQPTLIACGAYGRGLLNPGSVIDLLFLLPKMESEVDPLVQEEIKSRGESMRQSLLETLLALGIRSRYLACTAGEACRIANDDYVGKTSLLDARFIAGDETLFDDFQSQFVHRCLVDQEQDFFAANNKEVRSRHRRHGYTPHLQEPNVHEGCGGLRDYVSLIWVLRVLFKMEDLHALVQQEKLTEMAWKEMEEAFEFLHRVRDALHYAQEGVPGDILTLRLQGIIATRLGYPGQNVLRRSEAFMREYYRLSRSLFQHSTSLMQAFRLEAEQLQGEQTDTLHPAAPALEESFDGFISRGRLIYPARESIFREDPARMMRFFLHTQRRNLSTSPEIRRLFKKEWERIDGNFRRNRAIRDTFFEILQHRGQVALIFRRMHRVGFLGRYLPEFGRLTDLVQHEFFHRYSADEHTLRCIEVLDDLILREDSKTQTFRRIFQDLDDPVALYIALLLHDAGRAENVEHHEDASALLADEVCRRLSIRGDRRRLILFLVDHHLTFWRTATTTDISDPKTIVDFATTVKSASWLDALYLFTYVDSKGTSDGTWSDWKASLMAQLHRRSTAYFANRGNFYETFSRPLEDLKREVLAKLAESYTEEVSAHFSAMPKRYFHHRGVPSIVRHARLFRRFFQKLRKLGDESLAPVLGWEDRANEGYTLLEVAGWNRRLLLAKVAGALASENLNILSADLYSRSDDLVLNIFRICSSDYCSVTPPDAIERIEALIDREFRIEGRETSFRSLIDERIPLPPPSDDTAGLTIPQRVFLSNEIDDATTVLEIQTRDRVGLLYDIFSQLGNLGAEVLNARVSTQAGAAIDRFHLVDSRKGQKITEEERLRLIGEKVEACL